MQLSNLLNRNVKKQPIVTSHGKAICSKCNREIKLKPKSITTVNVENDIERMFFKCPHCKTKYTIAYSDAKFRSNIEKINGIFTKLKDKSLSEDDAKSLVEEKDKLVAENKTISQKYRKIYEEGANNDYSR